ncbi:MAG: hypothetical protein L6Q37_07705 [Bdellovibrionaceae bacterium]|nr:hypothetical protein [Pseudobdellovibrionaceae bacterium]NUM57388.1 hypothetical protein [Pseudobdellovibrionaceae bacterium]
MKLLSVLILFIGLKGLAAQVYLDVHIHDQGNMDSQLSENRILNLMNQESGFNHAFVLSHSYNLPMPDGKDQPKYAKAAFVDMLHTSQLVSKYPKYLSGLCGIRLEWQSLTEMTEKCFNLPNMIGLKIRYARGEKGISSYSKPLELILTKYSEKIRIILLHLPTGFKKQESNSLEARKVVNQEIETLVHVAQKHKNTIFVVAHSGNNPNTVIALSKFKMKNIFVEVSGVAGSVFNNTDKDFQYSDFINSWKTLGVDQVLFGSDIEAEDNLEFASRIFKGEVDSIISNSLLTENEKNIILIENGKKILKFARPDLFD